jgi:hypothetical protein
MRIRPRPCPLFAPLASAALALAWWALPAAPASAQEGKAPRQWAVLIGVQKHDEKRLNLRFTNNDVRAVRKILVERAGLPPDHVLQLTEPDEDGALNKERRPTLANLRRELPRFLARAGKDDRVIVFFSGHGVLYKGQAYLVPADFRVKGPAETGLPAAELRKALKDCPARLKFLVLDCCHAGSDRAVDDPGLEAERLARAVGVKEVPGCVVLASCRADEKSWEWPARGHGAFTYWLCRALEGAAASGDGKVTVAAVNDYVHDRVKKTVAQAFDQEQTPVLLGKVEGSPALLTLRPEPPESLCRRLAEHLDLEVRRHKLKKVGVLELLQPLGKVEKLGSANLPAYCAEKITAGLRELAGGAYVVLGAAEMNKAARGVVVEAVGDPAAMRRLGREAGGLSAVVVGTLRRRGDALQVQCELVSTADGNGLVTTSGLLPLSEDLLADRLSLDNRLRPPGGPYAPRVRQHVEEAGQEGHPLLNKDFPFRVELWEVQVRPGEEVTSRTPRRRLSWVQVPVEDGPAGKPRRRAELVIPARDGQVFEVRVANKAKHRVAMTLLVDGINSLGQRRERLGQAWSWVLDGEQEYTIEGWYLPKTAKARPGVGADFTLKRFQFVDVARSVAGRQRFGESVGLITAAFYAEFGRSLGVGEGPEEQRRLRTTAFVPGRLLGVVHLRYVDARELDKK